MQLAARRFNLLFVPVMIFFLLLLLPEAAHSETVIFQDSFSRPDSSSPGPQWQEYRVRRAENGAIPVPGETPWAIRGGALYFEETGKNSYIEDFIQTAAEFPVDNTRVEFEIRAKGGTRLGYIGPTAFWAGSADERREAHNVTANGRPILGVQAWYRWENRGTRGVWLHGINRHGDHPQLLFSGLNQGRFERHVITVQGGKMTYQSPDCPALTYDLRTPLQPGAARRFSFGARMYDNGVKQTIEIRNFKITSLGKPDPKLGDKATEKMNGEMARLSQQIRAQARSGMAPLVQQVLARVQVLQDTMEPQISSMLQPVISQVMLQMQTQAQTQMGAAQTMMKNIPQGGVPQIPQGIPPRILPDIPPGMFPGRPPGIPGMPQGMMHREALPGIETGILLAQAGPAQGAPSVEQIMSQVLEQVRNSVKSEMQAQSESQAKLIKPQVQALVQSLIDPMMPEIEQMAQVQAQALVPSLNSFIDSNLEDIMKEVQPLLPPDVRQLPESEIQSMLRQKIESELKPQIMAQIEDEIQVIIQEQIMAPIQSRVARMIRAQLAGVKSQVSDTADALVAGQMSALSIGPEIKKILVDSVDSVESCVLADAETMFRTAAPKKFLINVVVNGKTVSYDVVPVIKDGRTLVPLRAIAQSMGAQVQWDDQTQTISMSRGDRNIRLGIGDAAASVNDQQVKLDVPATIVNGRTLVPVRFISESMGAKVDWDQSSKTASIDSR